MHGLMHTDFDKISQYLNDLKEKIAVDGSGSIDEATNIVSNIKELIYSVIFFIILIINPVSFDDLNKSANNILTSLQAFINNSKFTVTASGIYILQIIISEIFDILNSNQQLKSGILYIIGLVINYLVASKEGRGLFKKIILIFLYFCNEIIIFIKNANQLSLASENNLNETFLSQLQQLISEIIVIESEIKQLESANTGKTSGLGNLGFLLGKFMIDMGNLIIYLESFLGIWEILILFFYYYHKVI